MKKYLIILTIGVVVLGFIIGGYILRNKNNGEIPGGVNNNSTSTLGNPSGVSGKDFPIKVIDGTVFRYFAENDGTLIAILTDGKIIRSKNNQKEELSASPIDRLINTYFSFDGKKLATLSGNRNGPRLSIFDIESKVWLPIEEGAESASWSPTDLKLVYLTRKSAGLSLKIIDLNSKKPTPKESVLIPSYDLQLNWIQQSKIVIGERPTRLIPTSAWLFDTKTGLLSPILRDEFGLEILWSQTGYLGLASMSGEDGNKLKIFDLSGKIISNLGFFSLADKCAFSSALASATSSVKNDFIICAVPENINYLTTNLVPDDYEKGAFFTKDNIYKIALDGTIVKTIFSADKAEIDAINLRVADNKLFFINRLDQQLYSISL